MEIGFGYGGSNSGISGQIRPSRPQFWVVVVKLYFRCPWKGEGCGTCGEGYFRLSKKVRLDMDYGEV